MEANARCNFYHPWQGGEQKQLPTPGYDAYQPVWSVQNKIAFDARAIGQTPNDIAIMNADGTGFEKITTDEKYDCSAPQWSPDGKKILFNRSIAIRKPWKEITKAEMVQKKKSSEIMTMNMDGSDIRNLVTNLEGEIAPYWSHEGKSIYFVTKQDTLQALYTMSMSEVKPTLMFTLSGIIYSVSISPDGKYSTYAAEREKKSAVYVMDLRTKVETKLLGD
ncbi:MAG: PD40 domain-containing protein [Ignavibacteria bacterium]|nr:PD40 domain-containing protein [Ignavibacteria bacterium]